MKFIKNNSYLLLVAVLCMIFTVVGIQKMEKEVAYQQLTVTEGDTLWDYAKQYGDHVPTDKWINEIVRLNNLSSTTIRVGDELQIPMQVKQFDRGQIATNATGDEK